MHTAGLSAAGFPPIPCDPHIHFFTCNTNYECAVNRPTDMVDN